MRATQRDDLICERLAAEVIVLLPGQQEVVVLDGDNLAVFDACDGVQDVQAATGLSGEVCEAVLVGLADAGLVTMARSGIQRRTVLAGVALAAPLMMLGVPAAAAATSGGSSSPGVKKAAVAVSQSNKRLAFPTGTFGCPEYTADLTITGQDFTPNTALKVVYDTFISPAGKFGLVTSDATGAFLLQILSAVPDCSAGEYALTVFDAVTKAQLAAGSDALDVTTLQP